MLYVVEWAGGKEIAEGGMQGAKEMTAGADNSTLSA